MQKILAILAIFILILTACGTSEPPTVVYSTTSDPALYEGWTVTLTDFNDTVAEILIDNTTITIKADRIYFYNQHILESGISVIEEEYESQWFKENLPISLPISGKITSKVNDKGYTFVYIDNQKDFQLTPQDLEVEATWPVFISHAGPSSEHPITIKGEKIEDWGQNRADQCKFMEIWSGNFPWLQPYAPKGCRGEISIQPYRLDSLILVHFVSTPPTTTLTCGRISDRYTISKVGKFLVGYPDDYPGEIPWPFANFWPASAVTVYDHKMGTEEIHVIPTAFPFGFFNPEYEGWADPPIQWFVVGDFCQIDTPVSTGEYVPEKQQYIEIQVANPRYNSPGCIAYRALGGAGSPSNPNWDPQCEHPTHTESIPVP